MPAYLVVNALSQKQNLGCASAAAVIVLLIAAVAFLPPVLLTAWQARRRASI